MSRDGRPPSVRLRDDGRVLARRTLASAVLTVAVVVLLAGCGHRSQKLLTTAQVQKAFRGVGLRTRVDFDCAGARKSSCVARALGFPHVLGMVSSNQSASRTNLEVTIQAWVLDSVRAANSFNRATTYFDKTGKVVPGAFLRLQARNVVIQVLRRSTYRAKAEAAVTSLG